LRHVDVVEKPRQIADWLVSDDMPLVGGFPLKVISHPTTQQNQSKVKKGK